jgi:hypothetical protein
MALPLIERRMGIDWCLAHSAPVGFCCGAVPNRSNPLRKYVGAMVRGKPHPFQEAGGAFTDVAEGPEALQAALDAATVHRIPFNSLIATQPVTPQHVGLLLRGAAPAPRTGNSLVESATHPTVVRVGKLHAILDGHHRAAAEWATGKPYLMARVLTGVTPQFANSAELMVKP